MNNLPDKIVNFLPPTIVELRGKRWVVFSSAGWFEVDSNFTMEDAFKRWVKWKPSGADLPEQTFEIASKRSGDIYKVKYKNRTWSCECAGFSFRRNCRHIKLAKIADKEKTDKKVSV